MICFGESNEKQVMESDEIMYSIILYIYIWYMAYENTGLFPISLCWCYQWSGQQTTVFMYKTHMASMFRHIFSYKLTALWKKAVASGS